MKCLVCGREFEGHTCDICHFPVIDFPGDPEEGIQNLAPTIRSYRETFAKKVEVGIVRYSWSIEEGKVVEGQEGYLSFGDLSSLMGQTVWLEQAFDSLSKKENVEITVYVNIKDEKSGYRKWNITVKTPNEQGSEKQYLGITVDEAFGCCLKVRSGEKEALESERFSLFSDGE